jgi:hypothetical protein
MAKAFKEAFQKYTAQRESANISLVQRLHQKKAPPYLISAAQKFNQMLNEIRKLMFFYEKFCMAIFW